MHGAPHSIVHNRPFRLTHEVYSLKSHKISPPVSDARTKVTLVVKIRIARMSD